MNSQLRTRSGEGMSVNLIIVVAIGLLVLVIAVILVNRSGRTLSDNASNDCIAAGGICQVATCESTPEYTEVPGVTCPANRAGNPQYCCRYNFGG